MQLRMTSQDSQPNQLQRSRDPQNLARNSHQSQQRLVDLESAGAWGPTTHAQVSQHSSDVNNHHGGLVDAVSGNDNEDAYIRALVAQLLTGQAQASHGIEACSNQAVLGGLGISDPSVRDLQAQSTVFQSPLQTCTESWKDPQIYLAAAARGKSTSNYHDTTDFVVGNSEEEIVVGGNDT